MLLSFGGLVTAVLAIVSLASVHRQAGSSPSTAFVMPLLLSTSGVLASYWGSVRGLWLSAGAMCAFVVLSLWSGGAYFAISSLLLLAAAVVAFVALQQRDAVVTLFWLVGASGVCLLFVLRAWLGDSVSVEGAITHVRTRNVSPLVWWGAAIFPLVSVTVAFLELQRKGR
jgi:hypothetical protein